MKHCAVLEQQTAGPGCGVGGGGGVAAAVGGRASSRRVGRSGVASGGAAQSYSVCDDIDLRLSHGYDGES